MLIRRVIDEAVADGGPFGPEALAARLRREMADRAPAAATAKEMAAAAVPRVADGFRLLPRWASTGPVGLPSAFGELLLLEQVPIEGSADRFLSMVLDARTRFALGFEDGAGGPAPLVRALLDAAEKAADALLPLSQHDGQPALRAAAGSGPEWAALSDAVSHVFAAAFRQAEAYRSGTFAHRVLGGRMAWIDLSLVSRRSREEWSKDEVAYAVRAHNRSRLIFHPELDDPLLRSGVAAVAAVRRPAHTRAPRVPPRPAGRRPQRRFVCRRAGA